MIKTRFTLLWVFTLMMGLTSFAQDGSDPAVTSRNLLPAPLQGVGSAFTLNFRIGNNGAAPISGSGVGNANRMQFGICLGKCAPNPASTAALSGPLLDYFDVTYNASSNCFEGRQKQNTEIGSTSVYSLSIAAIVTSASSNTAVNDIGASCNIAPNGNANPQPTDNDFASIYTHTIVTALPVALVDFDATAQENRTVLVTWKTSWERGNKGYVVERSKDLKNFEGIGNVNDVAGTSNSVNSYRFVDPSPYRGTSYYRLRQVDADGTSQTFPAESIVINGKYGVYPNPIASNGFTLELDEPSSAVLHLYNASGVEVGINKLDTKEMSTNLAPASKMTSGVYVLTVEERGTTRKHRLVVQ